MCELGITILPDVKLHYGMTRIKKLYLRFVISPPPPPWSVLTSQKNWHLVTSSVLRVSSEAP